MDMFKNKQTEQRSGNEYSAFANVEKNVIQSRKKAKDRLEFILVKNDEVTIELAQKIGKGTPLVINFEEIDTKVANKMLWFLSGVLFPLGGEAIEISERIYLFASHDNLKDNSLRTFVSEYRK